MPWQPIDKEHPHVDAKKVVVSGMSLGCIPVSCAAMMSGDVAAVANNDLVSFWAAKTTSVTEGGGSCGIGSDVDARRQHGFHRWFGDEPDLMAAIAPCPTIFAEGGSRKDVIGNVQRAYELTGKAKNVRVSFQRSMDKINAHSFGSCPPRGP